MPPFWRFDPAQVSLTSLSEVIQQWPAIEAVYSGFTGLDLAEQYRQEVTANSFLSRWRKNPIEGWWVIAKNGLGVSIVRDYTCVSDRATHAVEVSACGLAIYRHDLRRSSVLADRDRLFCLGIERADIDWMLEHFDADSAVDIRLAIRYYRQTIFALALTQEALPF
jgi:hypothetical protein